MSLPKQRKLIVLDLDETLVYATSERLSTPEAFTVGPYYAYLRPHLRPFLEFCIARFDTAVWTSSSADYANAVATHLFGSIERLTFLWSRSRCTLRHDRDRDEQYWIKDLKKVRRIGYALGRVIVVDDTAKKHERNYGNLVTVSPFEGRLDDEELPHLARYLEWLADVDDVRVVEKRWWRHPQARRDDGA
jgi:RNA polymerase II subunit A small phosphatase-like protein